MIRTFFLLLKFVGSCCLDIKYLETPLFDGVVQEHCEARVSHDQVNKLAKMKP